MVISPRGVPFQVDVKGLYKKAPWLTARRAIGQNVRLFYIFAFVPDNATNQFYVLTHPQVIAGINADIARHRVSCAAKAKPFNRAGYATAVGWDYATGFADRWDQLPQ